MTRRLSFRPSAAPEKGGLEAALSSPIIRFSLPGLEPETRDNPLDAAQDGRCQRDNALYKTSLSLYAVGLGQISTGATVGAIVADPPGFLSIVLI